jgi:outer membrane protein assembly factor BamD (BamD/ComL family)
LKRFFLAALLVFSAAFARGEDIKQYSFAGWLFDAGDYYRAISEYKRYIFYNPGGKYGQSAYYRIGLSYLLAEKYSEAASSFEETSKKFKGRTGQMSILAEAQAYSGKKDYVYSTVLARGLNADYPGSQFGAAARYIEGFNDINLRMYTEASVVFGALENDPALGTSSAGITGYLKKSAEIQERSPVLSSLFSAVLPGAGYAYCGKWAEGIISFALNAFFMYNTYQAFRNNQAEGKFGYGIPEVVFYFSNIYGSAAAASHFNMDEQEKFIDGAMKFRVDILEKDF